MTFIDSELSKNRSRWHKFKNTNVTEVSTQLPKAKASLYKNMIDSAQNIAVATSSRMCEWYV